MNFFETIYSWFTSFCCTEKVEYAMGEILDGFDETVLATDGYLTLGITTLDVSFLLCFAFYIWPLDHPRFKAWWAWLVTAASNSFLAFLIGLIYARVRFNNFDDPALETLTYDLELDDTVWFRFTDYVSVGLANIFVALLFFIAFSLVLNWFGKATKYSPFRK